MADGGYGRSDGYGGRGGGRARGGFRGTAENAKTKICTRWLDGDCRFGDRCNFAHGDHELRSLPEGEGGGRGGGGRGGGRGYGGRGGGYGGGYPQMGGYQGGYQDQAAHGGYDQRAAVGMHGGEDAAWAAQGYPTAGPNGWCTYRTKDTGEIYYHNHRTGITTWDRPAEWPADGL